ncbi:hypothetical protein TVAG_262620 [Trichomonas vaginalis G3]|uniref:DUF3447 domain-containing protein n=1 Tax=Trichomonas vaginalis (strain ATCC PRA-98 / G3) TaxID=412133 RepID=A2DUH4_TRIV3|nr:protein of unknown function (DUF3447) [Trichomonas vaginalis G3]EAY16012.1 hypothetical protein TVAG_262620 [Trichomonas vaginalis G3]KAI5523546.1 protein of unknown function (DUF3447) [Trichomonas vaginalis G3]|eukprot:XP_001328235.1 hypothetical protein [Trichomonas vaginalis G3]
MTDHDIQPDKYSELRSICKYYIDSYIALYQLKTEKEEELNSIYQMIKTELIDSKIKFPQNIIRDILNIIPYNNRYAKSYFFLAKLVSDEYHVKKVNNVVLISNFLFYKEYVIKLNISWDFKQINIFNLNRLSENTIHRAIMHNDKESLISFTERDGFNEGQLIASHCYPYSFMAYSLLELCCYYGSVDCFKLLRTKFNSKITERCLHLSFLGGNPEIMSECLKYQKPDFECMMFAIISHNIDFVTFLMNEYNIKIDLEYCGKFNNLDAFLVYYDQTNDIQGCFAYSIKFGIPSLCEYFLLHGANIDENYKYEGTALQIAARNNSKEITGVLLLHGANVNKKEFYGYTVLHYAAINNCTEIAELLISYGANVNEKINKGETALDLAIDNNSKETAELLISYGAKNNDPTHDGSL